MRLHKRGFFCGAFLALGCAGGQTGDLSGEHGDNGEGTASGGCEEQRHKLGSLNEQTELGSGADVLAFAERSFDAPLSWQAPSQAGYQVGPESGVSSIHLEVTGGQNAYYITYAAKHSDGGAEIAIGCPGPALGVDAHVTVTTEGGALAESFDTTLYARHSAIATLQVPLDLSSLAGSLAVSYSAPQTSLVQLGLSATLMTEGTTGSIGGIVQTIHGDPSSPNSAVSAGSALLATWPASSACSSAQNPGGSGLGVTVEQSALGISGVGAAELLASTTPAAVTWRDGSSTELTLAVKLTGNGCLRAGDEAYDGNAPAMVNYPARFTLSSADERLNGEYEGKLTTWPSAEGGNAARAEAFLEVEPYDLALSGFSSVELPDGAQRAGVWLEVQVGDGPTTGQLRLNALSDPPCLTNPQPAPEPVPGQGGGSPGCAGTSVTLVESAEWGG